MRRREVLRGDALRRAAITAAAVGGLGLVTRLLPAASTGGAHGTPAGVLLMGAVTGILSATTAAGIVLVYRTSRIVNFSQAAMGAVGAMFTYNFVVALEWPFPVAFLLGVAVSAGLGVCVELALRRFFDASRLVLTIATVGVMGMLGVAAGAINTLGLWGEQRSLIEAGLGRPIKPLGSCCFTVPPFRIEFGHVLSLVLVPVCLVAVGVFLRRTRLGAAVRAAGENVDRAEMLGINVRRVSTTVWALAGALAGVGVILRGTVTTFAVAGQASVDVMLPSLAAAVLGKMRNLPTAAVSALGIAVLQQALSWSYPQVASTVVSLALLVIIVSGPLLMRRALARERETSSWSATEEIRAVPRELAAAPEVRTWRNIGTAAVALLALAFPWLMAPGAVNLAGAAAIGGMVILSLIVLTGWTGQVSLGQWGLVAIGAVVGGALTMKAHVPFWFALPLGGGLTAGFAFVLGIPALRVRGLMLAVSSFAFAFAVQLVLFNDRWFGWLRPDRIDRPTLLMFDFEDNRSMYYLSVVFLGLSYLLVRTLRRGRPGRVLIALRDNEDEVAAMGSDPVLTRLAGFALSGFIAGVAGVLFAHHQRAVTASSFDPEQSLTLFLYAVIGGLGSPAGAIAGAAVQGFQKMVPADPILSFFLNPSFGVLVMLYLAPRGLVGLGVSARDSMLRVVSQRRGIPAPSLFADVDAEVIRRRLVPLAEPVEGRGLSTIPADRRYRLPSEIHAVAVAAGGRAPDAAEALAAAADSLEERLLAGGRTSAAGEG